MQMFMPSYICACKLCLWLLLAFSDHISFVLLFLLFVWLLRTVLCDTLSWLVQAEHQTSDILPIPSKQAEAHFPEQDSSMAVAAVDGGPVAAASPDIQQSSKGQLLKHINFWHEDELKLAHPEVQVMHY